MKSKLDARRFRADRPPAVLLGGLNVCRALGVAGIPVVVASAAPRETAFASRYCRGRLRLPSLDNRAAVADSLVNAGEQLASALGRRLPIPPSLDWETLERFDGPVLVKPRSKFGWDASPVYVKLFGRSGKARIFANGCALLREAAAHELREQLVIQEYVGGNDRNIWSFHGLCDEQSRLLEWFVGRKIRTYPALTGLSTYVELSRDDEVAALGRTVASALPLKGVFKIDVKRDARTGRLRILEVNARYNLWHYLGAVNGVNLPLTAYEYLVYGKRPAAARPHRTTRRWLYLRYDWHAYREAAARGELRLAGWLASLAAAPKVYQLFAWRDPLPFFDKLFHVLRSRLPRLRLALRRWLFTAS